MDDENVMALALYAFFISFYLLCYLIKYLFCAKKPTSVVQEDEQEEKK